MGTEPEDALIEACVRRDESAWRRFVARYSPLITAAALKCLRKCAFDLPLDEVEDIRQEVFSSIWRYDRLSALKDRRSVAPWLAIVTVNTTINYVKKMGLGTPAGPLSLFGRTRRMELAENLASQADGPADELLKGESSEKISRAIERLPHKERLVMKLQLFHGKRYREIAAMLGMPEGTVANCINRAKDRLRDIADT